MPSKVYLAIPLINEFENISNLMANIFAQDYNHIEVRICVNQPEAWWEEESKLHICKNNQETIHYLSGISNNLKVIDKSSQGLGWDLKKFGVGWARKLVMDEIANEAANDDIILTLDGDTHIKPTYISSVVNTIQSNPKAVALSIPYYHPLSGDEETDRNILRYEIYMRYYSLNLHRINNPYNFTALGSAIAVPVWAYKRVRGITPHKSGEDFYFLLKLKKFGEVLNWNSEKVYPAARYSDRVFFGTGPAMIKGREGNWYSYPFYSFRLFDEVKESFNAFRDLFEKDVDYPMKSFLTDIFKDELWFEQLKKNNKNLDRFYKACIDKVDALRILQYLKREYLKKDVNDNGNLQLYLSEFYDRGVLPINLSSFTFEHSSIEELNLLRNFLVAEEEKCQKNDENI